MDLAGIFRPFEGDGERVFVDVVPICYGVGGACNPFGAAVIILGRGFPRPLLPLMPYSVIHEVCSRLEASCSWDAVARPEGTAARSDINSFPRVWLMTSVSANRVGDAR